MATIGYGTDKSIEYKQTLLAIAKKQREIFSQSFDWSKNKTLPEERVKRGLFRKPIPTKKELLKQDLFRLREKAEQLREGLGISEGTYWWNLPWDKIEEYLHNDLTDIKRDGSWRFEQTMKAVEIDGGAKLLMVREEGHCSNFEYSSIYDRSIESAYTESERREIMRNYDKKVDNFNLAQFVWAESRDAPVQSGMTGFVYKDAADYYLSEGMHTDALFRSNYERSLYDERLTRGLRAVSGSSMHVTCVFAVGIFQTIENRLTSLQPINYELGAASPKRLADVLVQRHKEQDALVKCGAYLAECEDVKSIAFSLICESEKVTGDEYTAAFQLAELCTCLADKIVID